MRRPVRLQIKQKKYRSPKRGADEVPFPMNCLCSTCRLTLIPGGLSETLSHSPSTVHNRGTIYLVERLYSSSGKGNVPRTPSYSAHAEKQPFIYRHRRADAGSRPPRQHYDVQRCELPSVAAAGLPQRLPH